MPGPSLGLRVASIGQGAGATVSGRSGLLWVPGAGFPRRWVICGWTRTLWACSGVTESQPPVPRTEPQPGSREQAHSEGPDWGPVPALRTGAASRGKPRAFSGTQFSLLENGLTPPREGGTLEEVAEDAGQGRGGAGRSRPRVCHGVQQMRR